MLRKRRATTEPVLRSVEIHCHALPALDDGPPDIGESLEMCVRYCDEGVRDIVVSPHLFHPLFAVEPEAIRAKTRELAAVCEQAGLAVNIWPGAEVHLTPELLEHVDAGRAVTLADGKFLLLELPENAVPPLQDTVFQLGLRGLSVVLAHPERNLEFQRAPERLEALVAGGCFGQISAGSLLGDFGSSAQEAARNFLQGGLGHVVAGDAHGAETGYRPDFGACVRELTALVGRDEARRMVTLNPERILRGKPILHLSQYYK